MHEHCCDHDKFSVVLSQLQNPRSSAELRGDVGETSAFSDGSPLMMSHFRILWPSGPTSRRAPTSPAALQR
jgi:hypothetical protein